MVGISLKAAGRKALDLVYPPRCVVCGRHGVFLCAECLDTLPRADGRRCERCWLPLFRSVCAGCASVDGHVDRLRSVFRYEGDVRRIVRAFKFGGQSSLAPLLGELLADAYRKHDLQCDIVVPVPLTVLRKRQRGYNQSLLLAREVEGFEGIACVEALRRKGFAEPQATSISAEQRHLNVQDVFEAAHPDAIRDAHVLLIDDVATTGATLDACARVLLAAGARYVDALTLARED